MFSNTTLSEHVLRGIVGVSAFLGAVMLAPDFPRLSLALLPLGLVALRGCPMCWTMGLFESIANKFRRPFTADRRAPCLDGRCATTRPKIDAKP